MGTSCGHSAYSFTYELARSICKAHWCHGQTGRSRDGYEKWRPEHMGVFIARFETSRAGARNRVWPRNRYCSRQWFRGVCSRNRSFRCDGAARYAAECGRDQRGPRGIAPRDRQSNSVSRRPLRQSLCHKLSPVLEGLSEDFDRSRPSHQARWMGVPGCATAQQKRDR